jgi:hypothetical protein
VRAYEGRELEEGVEHNGRVPDEGNRGKETREGEAKEDLGQSKFRHGALRKAKMEGDWDREVGMEVKHLGKGREEYAPRPTRLEEGTEAGDQMRHKSGVHAGTGPTEHRDIRVSISFCHS